MQPEFWIQRWKEGKRGFHLPEPNEYLVKFAEQAFGTKGRILVPLCGATHDLRWLRDQGYEVVGIELSELAVNELAEREGLKNTAPGRFENDGIMLLQCNIFDCSPETLGPITGIWDRAALVALHPDQRAPYCAKLRELLGDSGSLLLNVFTYDQSLTDGPPWSIDEPLVSTLWPEATLTFEHTLPAMPRFRALGMETTVTRVYTAKI